MAAPLLLDLSHTAHTRARTGIQRVTRSLHAALGTRAVGITYDPHWRAWRELEAWEKANLGGQSPAQKRGAQWPVAARLRGAGRRLLGARAPIDRGLAPLAEKAAGLVVAEVFSGQVARALPPLLQATRGRRVAVFHDAIALKYPELTPAKTVARFPPYLVELLQFDGIAANSQDSRDALLDYWRWLGASHPPPVTAIPLGTETHAHATNGENSPPPATPVVLTVGSIEGRKNHLALLEACERLWSGGANFSLRIIGLAHPQTGAAALAKIRALQATGRPLRYEGAVGDAAVDAAYAASTFTVYPSMIEGFGLPVIESVAHGKPCICSRRGALGEVARGGGCVTIDPVDRANLASAIQQLLAEPATRARLSAEAAARRFKTWSDYAEELSEWICEIPRRSHA